uniref:Uncharacterized protein n=1 Tax=Candidatus Kentrum sp. UNK TaxID=2126344 RepID=A0A451B2T2_9GAMM|nr:MAG: hypothetical protein BECKUNK1418G_GA0071005_11325 [Candidatus Kentron sp. UNK]VFK72590.1 MAG: hypothetical protein BECKUNK1418H_GA0071006_11245 [Candidatus Kentron sp. UNK]
MRVFLFILGFLFSLGGSAILGGAVYFVRHGSGGLFPAFMPWFLSPGLWFVMGLLLVAGGLWLLAPDPWRAVTLYQILWFCVGALGAYLIGQGITNAILFVSGGGIAQVLLGLPALIVGGLGLIISWSW